MAEISIKWVMIIVGALTCTMFYAVLFPQAAFMATFGESLAGPLAEVVVRSWGVLVTLMGAMLLYGAFVPEFRNFSLTIATISKLAFIGLIIFFGNQYMGKAAVTIVFDSVASLLFIAYLIRHAISRN